MLRLSSLLENVTSVGITGHIRPDGDCVGSTLGLYNYITENYPDISTDHIYWRIFRKFQLSEKLR